MNPHFNSQSFSSPLSIGLHSHFNRWLQQESDKQFKKIMSSINNMTLMLSTDKPFLYSLDTTKDNHLAYKNNNSSFIYSPNTSVKSLR